MRAMISLRRAGLTMSTSFLPVSCGVLNCAAAHPYLCTRLLFDDMPCMHFRSNFLSDYDPAEPVDTSE